MCLDITLREVAMYYSWLENNMWETHAHYEMYSS